MTNVQELSPNEITAHRHRSAHRSFGRRPQLVIKRSARDVSAPLVISSASSRLAQHARSAVSDYGVCTVLKRAAFSCRDLPLAVHLRRLQSVRDYPMQDSAACVKLFSALLD
jgi:hypothetical protein